MPTADVTGVEMSIPMPGHPVSDKELDDAVSSVEKLEVR